MEDGALGMKRRKCCMAYPEFGPVCGCGGSKAKQAWTCQACHGKVRGYGRAARVTAVLSATSDRKAALLAAREAATGELAELVKAQYRDDRSIMWSQPCTVPLEAKSRYGLSLIETLAA